MMFAPDTNTIVYFFKGIGGVATRLLSIPPAQIGIPSVVLYELEIGIAQSDRPAKRRAQLDEMLTVVAVLPFDTAAAKLAARVESALRSTGSPIGPKDVLVAGTALAHNATLVTHNLREFQRVRGLSVVDWL
jgi:tRNA(fMet)-specific endonuclease VapC